MSLHRFRCHGSKFLADAHNVMEHYEWVANLKSIKSIKIEQFFNKCKIDLQIEILSSNISLVSE